MSFGNGPWKEGRLGASSLAYLAPREDQLPWVIANHRAVSIRATLALNNPALPSQTADLRSWNWDLAILDSPLAAQVQSALLPTAPRTPGLFTQSAATASLPNPAYLVTADSRTIPRAPTPEPLPSLPALTALQTFTDEIWDIATRGLWTIWRLDEKTLDALGQSSHAQLLRWLGDRHDRVYCAPVYDIRAWQTATP